MRPWFASKSEKTSTPVYEFVSANQADASNALGVRAMCKALGVSPSGYYDWQHRAPSARSMANLVLTEAIRKAHQDPDQTYGMPRVRAGRSGALGAEHGAAHPKA